MSSIESLIRSLKESIVHGWVMLLLTLVVTALVVWGIHGLLYAVGKERLVTPQRRKFFYGISSIFVFCALIFAQHILGVLKDISNASRKGGFRAGFLSLGQIKEMRTVEGTNLIEGLSMSGVNPGEKPTPGGMDMLFTVKVDNSGQPSVAWNWKTYLKLPGGTEIKGFLPGVAVGSNTTVKTVIGPVACTPQNKSWRCRSCPELRAAGCLRTARWIAAGRPRLSRGVRSRLVDCRAGKRWAAHHHLLGEPAKFDPFMTRSETQLMTEKMAELDRQLNLFDYTVRPLVTDIDFAYNEWSKQKGSQFWGRTTVRCISSSVEAILFFMRNFARHMLEISKLPVTAKDANILAEQQPLRGIQQATKETFRLFGYVCGAKITIDYSATEFEDLKVAFKKRNDIMHPKGPFDIEVKVSHIETALRASQWFRQSFFSVAHQVDEHLSRERQRLAALERK